MDDKSTLFAALVCAVVILVVTWWEHRPSFFWWRYLLRLEKTTPDEMEWGELARRIRKRVQKTQHHQHKCLSNGIIALYGVESSENGACRDRLVMYPKRGYNPHIPIVVIEFSNDEIAVALVDGLDRTSDDNFDPYQWMMEQMSNDTCYEIAKRAYICEQESSRGNDERVKVKYEYIQWITRKFI